jgi:hypothetical protein
MMVTGDTLLWYLILFISFFGSYLFVLVIYIGCLILDLEFSASCIVNGIFNDI